MHIIVITDNLLKDELLSQGIIGEAIVDWVQEPVKVDDADCYIDLLFDYSAERIKLLKSLTTVPIIVNAVNTSYPVFPENFVRICGWNTFLSRPIIEAASANENLKTKTNEVFSVFNKTVEWTPNIAGFISPRVISMIINEAYYTLEEKIASRGDIDTAMKLGTRYPFGPFEWSEKIGLKKIYELLENLSAKEKRYIPSRLLKQEAAYL